MVVWLYNTLITFSLGQVIEQSLLDHIQAPRLLRLQAFYKQVVGTADVLDCQQVLQYMLSYDYRYTQIVGMIDILNFKQETIDH